MAETSTINSRTLASLPATSLIICSRNRQRLLLETVESVLQGDEVPTEIVIVDQSDSPHTSLTTWKVDRACKLQYLWTNSVGLSCARNIGIAAAQHAILAIIDDDMFVPATWFGSLIRAFINAGERSVVTGRVLPTPAEAPGGFAPAVVVKEDWAVYEGRIGTDVLAGGHMVTYRSILDAVGGFDERLGAGSAFPAADDNDLGFRLLEAGYRIVYTPQAIVYHRAWRSRRDYLPMRWNYGRGKGGYYAKYFSLSDRHMLRRMGWDIGHRVFGFPHRLWRQTYLAYGDPAYICGILVGFIQWFLTERTTRASARSFDPVGDLNRPVVK